MPENVEFHMSNLKEAITEKITLGIYSIYGGKINS